MFWLLGKPDPTFMAVRVVLATDQNWDDKTGVYACETRHIRRIDMTGSTNWTVVHVDNSGGVPKMVGVWPHIARAAVSVEELYYCSASSINVNYSTVPIDEINMDDAGVEHTVLVVVNPE